MSARDIREVGRGLIPFGARRWLRLRQRRLVAFLAKPLAPFVRDIVYRRPYVPEGSPDRLYIGRRVFTMNTIFNVASGTIRVGDGTIFGHNCMVLTGRHEFEQGRRRRGSDVPLSGFDIRIGRDCWIASGAVILGGVTIGDSVIVAAGAVVVRDVESGEMVGGVPARVLGQTP